MKTFTIENETNNITVHASTKDAKAIPNSEMFSNEVALARLASGWTATRLVEIWNSVPGVVPVKKFTNRKTAVTRLWTVLQSLDTNAAVEGVSEPEQVPEAESIQAQAEDAVTVAINDEPAAVPEVTASEVGDAASVEEVEPVTPEGASRRGYACRATDAQRCARASRRAEERHPRQKHAHHLEARGFARGEQDGNHPGPHEAPESPGQ